VAGKFERRNVRRVTLGIVALLLAAGPPPMACAVVIFDTGTPDEYSNLAVLADPTLSAAQFLAQDFTLTAPAQIDTVEAYLGGLAGETITMDLASKIGMSAAPSDLLSSFSLLMPGNIPNDGAFVSATVNQVLQPGTYFLVFSAGTSVAWMPIAAPTAIGNRFIATDISFPFVNVNTTLPIASKLSSLSLNLGIRISGTVIPEPSPVVIWSLFSALGLIVHSCRRNRRAAQQVVVLTGHG
jgi:hypothetical protein